MIDILTILTVRCASERLPNKALADVNGVSLTSWIIERLHQIGGHLILATTANREDDPLDEIAENAGIPIYRHEGDDNDVLGRMHAVVGMYPDARYIFRAMGDCPFVSTKIVKRAAKAMNKFKAETFSWALPPEIIPVYGSREFPYHINAWHRVVKNAKGEEREHIDQWYCNHRDRFNVLYHEGPVNDHFRTYRLEVDYPEDLELIREIAKGPGMLADVPTINLFLDNLFANNPEKEYNRHCIEKTGPLTTYGHQKRREWYYQMVGKPIVDWKDNIWRPTDKKAVPVFCNAGYCFLGHAWQGKLYLKEGHIITGLDLINCQCGAKKIWKAPI